MDEEMTATGKVQPAATGTVEAEVGSPWSYAGSGFLAWLLQRVTAIGLVVLLPIHVVINHLANISKVEEHILPGLVVFSDVAERFESPAYWTVDVLLLSFALYHGLNGVRNVAVDYGVRGTASKVFTGALCGVGAAAFAFGIIALAAFID